MTKSDVTKSAGTGTRSASLLLSRGTVVPLSLIALSLLALLLIPIVTRRDSERHQEREREVAEPVQAALDSLQMAVQEERLIVQEAELAEGTPDPAALGQVHALQRRQVDRLADRARRLDPEFEHAVARLREQLRRSHAPAGEQPAGRDPQVGAAQMEVLAGVADVRARMQEVERRWDEDRGLAILLRDVLTTLLSFLALAALAVVTRIGRRLRAAARSAAQEHSEKATLLNSMAQGTYGIDRQERCTFINRAGAAMLGYRPEELIGMPVQRLLYRMSGPRSEYRSMVRRALEAGEAVTAQTAEFRRRDGSTLSVEYMISPLWGEGRIDGAVVTFSDITERELAERERERLLAAERQARHEAEDAQRRATFLGDASALFSRSLDCEKTLCSLADLVVPRLADSCILYLRDATGEIRRLNPRHVDPEMEAQLREQLEQKPPELEFLIPPVRNALLHGETSVVSDVSAVTLKAQPTDMHHTSSVSPKMLRSLLVVPLRARDQVVGAISYGSTRPDQFLRPEDVRLAEDLASRAALAIDNARLYEQSQAAVHTRDEVLGIVSHDLRSPLQVVRMSAQALQRHWPAAPSGSAEFRQLRVIEQSADHMYRLIRDLLDVSQIDAGVLSVNPAPVDVESLVTAVADQFQALAAERGVALEVHPVPDLPQVHADRERIIQTLSNLISNGVRFTPSGGIVTLRAGWAEGGMVQFHVEDTGCGLPADELSHIFDRAWQQRRKRQSGAGLGLAIARGIVERHGGEIFVHSTEGEGTTFSFTLPAVVAEEDGSSVAAGQSARPDGADSEGVASAA